MSIPMDAQCVMCHLQRNIDVAQGLGAAQEKVTAFAKDLMRLHLTAPEGVSSPYLGPQTNALFLQYFGLEADRYRQEKEDSNRFVLERMDTLRRRAQSAADPVFAGIQLAILGNYLDFAALRGAVSFEKLDEALDTAFQMELDTDCYRQLQKDLTNGKRLLYITDNAGEIGFDRILAEELQRAYPHLEIIFCVRGEITQNDATREDAAAVGVSFPVIDNGNGVAGTEITMLSREAKTALENADVIIAKGMGNTETLYGCGYNVYYAFLVKCGRLQRFFGKPMMTPMLVRDKI